MQREINLLRRENVMLRESPRSSTSTVASRATINIKNIGELLSDYHGAEEDFLKWKSQVQLIRNTYDLDENASRILVSSKLKGKALSWYHSKAEYLSIDFQCLFEKMESMFHHPLSKMELRRNFEARKWQKDESFEDYCHQKLILGNKIPVQDDEVIDYLIDGIPSETLQNQARMHPFSSVQELLRAFKKIKLKDDKESREKRTGPLKTVQSKPTDNRKETLSTKAASTSSKASYRGATKCYECGEIGHYARDCPQKKKIADNRDNKITPKERKKKEQLGLVEEEQTSSRDEDEAEGSSGENEIYSIDVTDRPRDQFEKEAEVEVGTKFACIARIDTGCPISLVREQLIPQSRVETVGIGWEKYRGINNSRLCVIGTVKAIVSLEKDSRTLTLVVVPDNTMSISLLLGRDALEAFGYALVRKAEYVAAIHEMFSIEITYNESIDKINVNSDITPKERKTFESLFRNSYVMPERPPTPQVKMDAAIILKKDQLIQFGPRRLSHTDKGKVSRVITGLLEQGVIRPSESEYASPIVLTRKKNGDIRMCVDYRALNKVIARDNYPLPLIEDQLDRLRGKRFFSTLDLKDGFYHIAMAEESIKYTSFVTSLGQFEFLRMPFGLKIGPQRFQRFINAVMDELIKSGDVVVYLDDILIATKTLEDHFKVLTQVFLRLVRNKLELRLEKYSFLYTRIEYLGYSIDYRGLRPTNSGIIAVQRFPEPKTIKKVHSFIGLASYFRKFIENFAIVAKPLYSLLKKDATFKFEETEKTAFEKLKCNLTEAPTLAIYNPTAYTELHCDASSLGFGAILMQRQMNRKMHPVLYFSKRTTEVESKYHSFELETLAIVYATRRFRVYLQGIPFTIVSDCSAVMQTLEKKDINARIARWSLELQSFEYNVVHRNGSRMKHVDALSRSFGILILEDNPFEWNLILLQSKDSKIKSIADKLEVAPDPYYELRNGLIYKKHAGKLLFLVPERMEKHVLFHYHNEKGHIGSHKMIDLIKDSYWFPDVKAKCEEHIRNCLKCISFSPGSGKSEGCLHPIPKGKIPFEIIHIDHLGPIDKNIASKKYILLVVDAFSKFVQLYATRTTDAREAISWLTQYFRFYSKPKMLISDRGSAFTSTDFRTFMEQQDIKHIKIATSSPQANGQAERVNRVIIPMLAKISSQEGSKSWYRFLGDVEYCINNTVNRTTGSSPSQLVFGIQRNCHTDKLKEYIDDTAELPSRDLEHIRDKAAERTCVAQQ